MTNSGDIPFFVAGGTLQADARSYVVREADRQLLEGLRNGEFCYVLNARQTGKSSLMIHTARRLREAGARVVVLDLAALGQNVMPEQWYYGLLNDLGEQLGLRSETRAFWRQNPDFSPLQKLIGALRQVVLPQSPQPLVLFVDEIDVVRSLPHFSADELFIAIRECYNRRAQDAEFQRLTFCLLGVATPADLIWDARATPFNIGRRIELTDFTAWEAASLAEGLRADGRDGAALLRRILFWTGGHPYMTQRFCQSLVEQPTIRGNAAVDRVCQSLFLSRKAQQSDDNLALVRNQVLKSDADLSSLLHLYAQVRRRREGVKDDRADYLMSVLRLSGIVRVENGRLRVRNRIYHRVFDQEWIRTHTPGAEWRRQQAAFRRGVLRTATVASLLLMVMGGLAREGWWAKDRAEQSELRMRRIVYDADMALAQQELNQHHSLRARQLLEFHRNEDGRGFEWAYLWRLCHQELLTGHNQEGFVYTVAFVGRQGERVATGDDSAVTLWETRTGRIVARLRDHGEPVIAMAASADGQWLATASEDGTVQLRDSHSGQTKRTLQNGENMVECLAFLQGSKSLATGDDAGNVKLWNVLTGKKRSAFRASAKRIDAIALFAGETQIATGNSAGEVTLWDLRSGRKLHDIGAHHQAVRALAFSPDGKWLATAGEDSQAKLWKTETWQPVWDLTKHNGAIFSLAFSPDSRRLATASEDRTIRLWDVATGAERRVYDGHTRPITSVAFSPDGSYLASGSRDATWKLWDAREPGNRVTLPTDEGTGDAFLSPDGRRVAITGEGGKDSVVPLWNAVNGQQTGVLRVGAASAWCVAFSPDGSRVAVGGIAAEKVAIGEQADANLAGVVFLCDTATGKTLQMLPQPRSPVYSLAFSQDGRQLATGSEKRIAVWDLAGNRDPYYLPTQERRTTSLAFSRDGRWLAAGGSDGKATVWDMASRKSMMPFIGHQKRIGCLAFSPEGRLLVTGSDDSTMKLWDLTTGRETLTVTVEGQGVDSVAFVEEGMTLLSVSDNKVIQRWQAARNAEIVTRSQTD